MKETDESPDIIDIKHVTCGLVPLMQTHLEGADLDQEVVKFKIRQGIETELWNSFGTGKDWRLFKIEKELFHDVASFVRMEIDTLDPLGLMDF